ncbi:hypothetical protein PFISCL1PPCAC_23248, partial [Pristionchus fissidentatus]
FAHSWQSVTCETRVQFPARENSFAPVRDPSSYCQIVSIPSRVNCSLPSTAQREFVTSKSYFTGSFLYQCPPHRP